MTENKNLVTKEPSLFASQKSKFVSRGGIKLQAALDQFGINAKDKIALDVGSSTGGFVDCLLQNGAKKVYSVDTAYGELAWKLRNDPRVVVMERTNILHVQHLGGEELGSEEMVDLVTIDASWTKLGLSLPVVKKFLKPRGLIIALLKPHYEANRKLLVKGVLPMEFASSIKDQVSNKIKNLGFKIEDEMESPILGGGGNKEFLLKITV